MVFQHPLVPSSVNEHFFLQFYGGGGGLRFIWLKSVKKRCLKPKNQEVYLSSALFGVF